MGNRPSKEGNIDHMDLNTSKKNIIYLGCILMVSTIQLSAMGLNNTMYAILTRMDGLQYYALLSVLAGLGTAIMTPVGGKLGDLFGRRNIAMVGAALSLAFMVIMGISQNLFVFIVCRALLSFGIGIFTSIPFAICADIFPREVLGKKVGMLSATLAAAIFLGATIAGMLNDVDLISVAIIYPGIICIIGAMLIFLNMPNSKSPQKPVIDFAGIALLAIFMTSLSLSFSFANSMGFTHPVILAGFAVTIFSAVALYQVEKRKAQPIIPFYLFKNMKYTGVCLIAALLSCYQVVMGVYVPVTGQAVMGLSSTVTGFVTLPRTIFCVVLPAVTAVWVSKHPARLRQAQIIAGVCISAAFTGMSFTGPNSPVFLPFMLLAITGIGEGFRAVAGTPLVVQQLEPKDIGVGIALVNTMGSLGPTIAAAVLGAVYNARSAVDINGALVNVYWITTVLSVTAALIAIFMLRDTQKA